MCSATLTVKQTKGQLVEEQKRDVRIVRDVLRDIEYEEKERNVTTTLLLFPLFECVLRFTLQYTH
jgi:hypothetical protein